MPCGGNRPSIKSTPRNTNALLARRNRILASEPEPIRHAALSSAPLPVPGNPASPLERIHANTFITTQNLSQHTTELLAALPPTIDTIVGVARSGMIPASIMAAYLHVPLLSLSQDRGLIDIGHGARLRSQIKRDPTHILIVDDTVATGNEMSRAVGVVASQYPKAMISKCAIYSTSRGLRHLDYAYASYDGLHFLEWNFQNAGHGAQAAYDFDGVLCRDFTYSEMRNAETYIAAIRNIEPKYLPRRTHIQLIVTARPQWTRTDTLAWLSHHGITTARLEMWPGPWSPDAAAAAEWKAEHFKSSKLPLFIESSTFQAKRIHELTGLPVLSIEAKQLFANEPPSPSVATKATNFAKAVANHVANGRPKSAQDTVDARLAICRGCEHYRPSDATCGQCGCHVAWKAAWLDQQCPLSRWPGDSAPPS
jgi:hypoxanthine phosphoribosyltransferase